MCECIKDCRKECDKKKLLGLLEQVLKDAQDMKLHVASNIFDRLPIYLNDIVYLTYQVQEIVKKL